MSDWEFWTVALLVVDVALATAVTFHAVLWKRDSRAVIGWVGLAWLSPILGSLAYLCFGINRIERKAASLESLHVPWVRRPADHQDDVSQILQQRPGMMGLVKAGSSLTGLPVEAGNRVEPLIDGDQAFPSMIKAINEARRSVALLSYIFDSDRVGDAFLEALVEATNRGVAVRVLVDHVGSQYSRPDMVSRLKRAGVTAASFLPTLVPRLPTYANLRNHRKILVVDGEVGFCGGTNIREVHALTLNPSHPAPCLHFRLAGPIVPQLQHVFAVDWEFTTGEPLNGPEWEATTHHVGDVWARGIEDGPDQHFEKLSDLMAAALASAEHHARIVTPYFLPSATLIKALNVAALRGVKVEIFLPSKNNIALVQWACSAQLWQNLEKGCHVFYTSGPFDHTKLMIVDGVWSLIGSTNWDPRSLRLNFEFNVECYSAELAVKLNAIVDGKAQTAREVTLAEVNSRSLPIRLRDGLARLFSPYL